MSTGALVNTDSVFELCCFPSTPVYLFQSFNHNPLLSSDPILFYPAVISYTGEFLACRDAGQHSTENRHKQRKQEAGWKHKVLVRASQLLSSIKLSVNVCHTLYKLRGYMALPWLVRYTGMKVKSCMAQTWHPCIFTNIWCCRVKCPIQLSQAWRGVKMTITKHGST